MDDWKTKEFNSRALNKYIDRMHLLKNPPIKHIGTNNIPIADYKPGYVIKFKWYQRLYNWLWNKLHKI